MKKKFNQVFYSSIIISICLLILGGILVILPDISFQIITYITAAILMINGIFCITIKDNNWFFNDFLILGLIELLFGIIILINPDIVKIIVPIIVGVVIVIKSFLDIKMSVYLASAKVDGWILMLICSVISIILGMIIIINPSIGSMLVTTSLGILLILSSISTLIDTIWLKSHIKKIVKLLENK